MDLHSTSDSRKDWGTTFWIPSSQTWNHSIFMPGFTLCTSGDHRLLAKRFPFAIYYRIQNEVVRVYAILDCRRDPAWIHDRLA